jgi:porphobilinogen synthase
MKKARRLRKNHLIRDLISEANLSVNDLIMPYFIVEGENKKEIIKSMPGVYRFSIDNLIRDIKEIKGLGIKAILIFGISSKKDNLGSEGYSKKGIIQKAIKAIRKNIGDIIIFSDVCLCGYTSYGHCGIIRAEADIKSLKSDFIDNDATLEALAKIALSHAEAGVDFVAPSAMMDGQVMAIRNILDNKGFENVGILAYSAKYASNFYAPFREALNSSPQFGDRKTYQMDFRNSNEALREVKQDIEEGADMVMVKPALSYLDIIRMVRDRFNIPVAAYNVSGEYTMIKRFIQDEKEEKNLAIEILTSIKRAGADLIITYYAKKVATWIK